MRGVQREQGHGHHAAERKQNVQHGKAAAAVRQIGGQRLQQQRRNGARRQNEAHLPVGAAAGEQKRRGIAGNDRGDRGIKALHTGVFKVEASG